MPTLLPLFVLTVSMAQVFVFLGAQIYLSFTD